MYSDDYGETWHYGDDVTAAGLSGENQLVELDDGALLTGLRENGAWDGAYHVNRMHIGTLGCPPRLHPARWHTARPLFRVCVTRLASRTQFARSIDGRQIVAACVYAGKPNNPEVNCEGSLVAQSSISGQRLISSSILGGGIDAPVPEPRGDGGAGERRRWPHLAERRARLGRSCRL
eukprot:3493741-Prymnesium_polylepis.1